MAVDMNIDMSRGWSVNSSTNSSRASSIHLNMSSIAYVEQVQVFNNNPIQADQVEISKSQGAALFYTTPKVGENNNANEAIIIEFIPEPHDVENTNANNNMY